MRRPLPCPALLWKMAALLAAAAPSGAAVIHVDLTGAPQPIPATLDGLYVNFRTGATSTAAMPLAGWDFNPYYNGSGLTFFAPDSPMGQGTLVSGSGALALLDGEIIGGSGLYQSGRAAGTLFLTTGISYAGLRFWNESAGSLNYGWAKLSTTAGTGFPAALLGYAYEDTGAPIPAGQIPEPAAGLLALSGLVLLGRRRTGVSIKPGSTARGAPSNMD